MFGNRLLLSVLFLIVLVSFVSALNVNILSPSEGAVFNSSDQDILVRASVESESTCDVWGYVNTPSGKRDINPKECDICSKGSGGIYANSVTAYLDAIAGGNYEVYVTCTDRNNQIDSKIVNFRVEGNMATDTTAPIVTINFPMQGGDPYSNINLDFDVNELSSCLYSVSPQDYNGGSGIGFSGYINGITYETSLKQSTQYSLTVTCTDLMGNVGSKTISFTTQNRACATCAVPSNGTSGSGSGGGGGSVTTVTCTDSDSGKDYFEKGETVRGVVTDSGGSAGAKIDRCYSEEVLTEYYCGEDKSIKSINYTCPNSCQDGACIPSSQGNGSSGGGGGVVVNDTCTKYYTCPDGTKIKQCELADNGMCGCWAINCPTQTAGNASSGGASGGGSPTNNSGSSGGSSGGGGGSVSCTNGCKLNNTCVPISYITNKTYCSIDKTFVAQKGSNEACENNFECSTNLCVDNKCVSSGFWQRFIRWLSRFFSG